MQKPSKETNKVKKVAHQWAIEWNKANVRMCLKWGPMDKLVLNGDKSSINWSTDEWAREEVGVEECN